MEKGKQAGRGFGNVSQCRYFSKVALLFPCPNALLQKFWIYCVVNYANEFEVPQIIKNMEKAALFSQTLSTDATFKAVKNLGFWPKRAPAQSPSKPLDPKPLDPTADRMETGTGLLADIASDAGPEEQEELEKADLISTPQAADDNHNDDDSEDDGDLAGAIEQPQSDGVQAYLFGATPPPTVGAVTQPIETATRRCPREDRVGKFINAFLIRHDSENAKSHCYCDSFWLRAHMAKGQFSLI